MLAYHSAAAPSSELVHWRTTHLRVKRNFAFQQDLRDGMWKLYTTFTSYYLMDVTHRPMDTFSIGPLVHNRSCNSWLVVVNIWELSLVTLCILQGDIANFPGVGFLIACHQLQLQGVLSYTCFGLHGFSCTRLRKIINIKKIVRFTTRNSAIHDFRAHSSENCSICDAEISYTRFLGSLKHNYLFMRFLVYTALSGM